MSLTETAVWIGWSRRTSCRSMCVSFPRTLLTWNSFRIAECEPPPSTVTSRTACIPPLPVSAVRRSRSATAIATGSDCP